MADRLKKTKATATPRQASAKSMKVAEVAKPTTSVRKRIELVAKVEEPKKAKVVAPKPIEAAPKKENVVAISQPKIVSREMIEQVAYKFWAQSGYQHGHALEDWIRAETELLERAS